MRALLFMALVVSVLGAAFPVEVVDDRGQAILILAEPQRVVVAGVALYAEILVDLGLAGRVVGVSTAPGLPEALAGVPRIGPAFAPSFELILALEPDVVLGAWGETREKLERLGIIVVTGGGPEGWIQGITDVFRVILLVGQVMGATARAEALVGQLAQEIVTLESKLLDQPKKGAVFLYLLAPDSPPFAAGRGTPEHELLLRAGGANLFSDVTGYPQVSLEELLRRDPEVIFTDPAQVENFEASALLRDLRAVREKKVVGIPAAWVVSTKLGRALELMARALHPEVFGR